MATLTALKTLLKHVWSLLIHNPETGLFLFYILGKWRHQPTTDEDIQRIEVFVGQRLPTEYVK
jgi:hypothetical protein